MTVMTLLPLWYWKKWKCKTVLSLVQLWPCWTTIPVWSTYNRHEIPEFDSLHWHPHKNQFQHMEYICTLTKIINVIFPFLSKRFLSFLNINSYPWHFSNPEYPKRYCKVWATTKYHRGNFSLSNRNNSFDILGLIYSHSYFCTWI